MENEIKPVFNLGVKQILSGLSLSEHLPTALFSSAENIFPFVDPFPESVNVGLLQTSGDPVTITGFSDNPFTATVKVSGAVTGSMYMMGDAGYFYSLNLDDESNTVLRGVASTVTDPANAVEIHKPTSGTEYLYYWQKTQIGKWDLTSAYNGSPAPSWTDNWATGLQSTVNHPKHTFLGDVYFGNNEYIGKLYTTSYEGGYVSTTSLTALDFPSDFTVMCLNDDGYNLVIGIQKNIYSISLRSQVKVLFWDTLPGTLSPNKEWTIPDYNINSIQRFRDGFIAICSRGIYYFNYDTKPKLINVLTGNYRSIISRPEAADVYNDAILWGGAGQVNSYGKFVNSVPDAFFTPFGKLTADVTLVKSNIKVNKIFVANQTSGFYSFTLSDSGATTSSHPQTTYFDLGTETQLTRIDLLLGEPVASTDSFTLQVQGDADNAAFDYGTISGSNADQLGKKKISLFKQMITNQIKLKLQYNGGNIKIKNIIGYGKPYPY